MQSTRSKFNDVYDTAADYYRPLGQAAMSGANKFGEILNHPLNSWSGMGMLPKAGLALSALLAAGYRSTNPASHQALKRAAAKLPDEGMRDFTAGSRREMSFGQLPEGPPPASFVPQENVGIQFTDLRRDVQSSVGPQWGDMEKSWEEAWARARKADWEKFWAAKSWLNK
jgi:hypothetical protein